MRFFSVILHNYVYCTLNWTSNSFLGFMANYEKKELINHSSVILHQMAPHLFFKKDLCSLKSIFPQFVNFLFFSWFWIFSGAWRFPWDSSLYWCRFSLYGVPKIQSPNHQRKCCLKLIMNCFMSNNAKK